MLQYCSVVAPVSLRNNLGLDRLRRRVNRPRLGGGVSEFYRYIMTMRRSLRQVVGLLSLAFVVIGLLGGTPSAQQLSGAERTRLQGQKDELFQRMLRDPANLDVTFAYADVSAKLG